MNYFLRTAAASVTLYSFLAGFTPPRLDIQEGSDTPSVSLSEREGVRDLRRLVLEAEKEEVWAFLPGANRWEDIGMQTYFVEGLSIGVNIDKIKIYELAEHHPQMIFYHIHPKRGIVRLMKPYLDQQESVVEKEQMSQRFMINAVVPSAEDLASALQLGCVIGPQHRYRVASYHGITEYAPHFRRLKGYCFWDKDNFEDEDRPQLVKTKHLTSKVLKKVRHEDTKNKVTRALQLRRPIVLLSDKYFTITFTPYSTEL